MNLNVINIMIFISRNFYIYANKIKYKLQKNNQYIVALLFQHKKYMY